MSDGKYAPLKHYLSRQEGSKTLRFDEIEATLGFTLPQSARAYQAWWANDPKHVQAKAWLAVDARSGKVDLSAETVTFTRNGAARPGRGPVRGGDKGKSKYSSFGEYLSSQYGDHIAMSFAEVERVLGFGLPSSARAHRPWWSNAAGNNPMTRTWLDRGFRTEQVNLAAETVVFVRVREGTLEDEMTGMNESPQATAPGAELPMHPAFGALKGMITIMPGVDLTESVDPEWVETLYDTQAKIGGLDEPAPDDR